MDSWPWFPSPFPWAPQKSLPCLIHLGHLSLPCHLPWCSQAWLPHFCPHQAHSLAISPLFKLLSPNHQSLYTFSQALHGKCICNHRNDLSNLTFNLTFCFCLPWLPTPSSPTSDSPHSLIWFLHSQSTPLSTKSSSQPPSTPFRTNLVPRLPHPTLGSYRCQKTLL